MAQMTYSNGSGCFRVTGYPEEMSMENLSGHVEDVGYLVIRTVLFKVAVWGWETSGGK